MPWPAALTVVPVHIKIAALDALQTPAIGRVIFEIPYPLRDAFDHIVLGPQPPIIAILDENGEATIELPATNDPQITPLNWTYRVIVETDVWEQTFRASVPFDTVGILEFDTMTPAVTPPSLIVYAQIGHTHDNLIPKSLFEAKGDLLVATAAGVPARLAAGIDGRVLGANSLTASGLEWIAAGGAATGRYRGIWQPGTVYDAGDTVFYDGGYYGAVNGALADVAPFELTTFFAGQLASVTTTDQDDYQFLNSFTVSQEIRLDACTWDKITQQNNSPHELRVFDLGFSTATPQVSVTTAGETASGPQAAPIVYDLQPGRSYRMSLVTGTGSEGGYRFQANFFAGPQTVGSVTVSGGGFVNGFAGVAVPQSPTTYYGSVSPRWREPSVSWQLLCYHDPVAIGNARAFIAPNTPT
jgi:hypothetical protein